MKRIVNDTETFLKFCGYDTLESILLSEYQCGKCGTKFIDRSDDYKYCPYCGRKIERFNE